MNPRGSTFVVLGTLVLFGVILADVLTHPHGTQVAGNQATTFAKTNYNAMLGAVQ